MTTGRRHDQDDEKAAGGIPSPRWAFAVETADGRIYAIGGADGVGSPLSQSFPVEVYDPSTDTWTSGAPLPTPRCGLGTGALDGKIYAIGGRASVSGSAHYATVEVYDPATDSWSRKTDMPRAQAWFNVPSVRALDGRIYVLGGMVGQTPVLLR